MRVHLIAAQTIRREFPHGAYWAAGSQRWVRVERGVTFGPEVDVRSRRTLETDPAVWVWACGGPCAVGGHHGMLDGGTLRVPRSGLPGAVIDWAVEHGMDWYLDRTYEDRVSA